MNYINSKEVVNSPKYYLDVKKWFILPTRQGYKGRTDSEWKDFKNLKREDFDTWRQESAIGFENNQWRSGYGYYAPCLLLGEANGLIMVDCDTKELFGRFGAYKTPQISTARGGHVFFKYNKDFADKLNNKKVVKDSLELDLTGITPLPPYQHPTGK